MTYFSLTFLGALFLANAALTFGCWIDFRHREKKFCSGEHEAAEAAALAFCGYSSLLTAILFLVVLLK